MQINVRVQVERPDSYMSKAGKQVNSVLLACQDIDPSGVRLMNTFEYTMTDEEKAKYAGKLMDRELILGVHEFYPFGGRLRARGKIMSVPTLDGQKGAANTAPANK